jgi:ketosteroid isomerase-like protein
MSKGNVETVRQSFEACNRHDADAAVANYHADIEYRFVDSLDRELVYRGRTAVKETFLQIWADWQETFSDPVQLFDLGDQVLVEHVDSRIGRDGIRIDDAGGQVWTLEDGLIVRIEGFDTWPEALEAAGLSERDAQADSS